MTCTSVYDDNDEVIVRIRIERQANFLVFYHFLFYVLTMFIYLNYLLYGVGVGVGVGGIVSVGDGVGGLVASEATEATDSVLCCCCFFFDLFD